MKIHIPRVRKGARRCPYLTRSRDDDDDDVAAAAARTAELRGGERQLTAK